MNLLDDKKRNSVVNPAEEESYILEFKSYWLLSILTYKNSNVKDYLKKLEIFEFINEKSKKYLSLVDLIVENKNKALSNTKNKAMIKNIIKFFEFVYYLVVNDKEDVLELSKGVQLFTKLLEKIDEKRKVLEIEEKEYEVFEMMDKIVKLALNN